MPLSAEMLRKEPSGRLRKPDGSPAALGDHTGHWELMRLSQTSRLCRGILTDHAVENALLVHAASGGSTNILLHLPAAKVIPHES